jgi:hypothetical protein
MELENKTYNSCPYCGSEAKTGMIANSFWKCGNATTHENRRSELCREREAHNQTKRERDEARKHLKEIEEYGTDEINAAIDLRRNLSQALVDLNNMQDQRDLAMKVIKRIEEERDEANTNLKQVSSKLADALRERDEARVHWGTESMNAAQFFGEKTKAIAERDEAREALEHIVEYWNRDENERSMSDALWHIIQTAVDVLHATKLDQLKEGAE